MDAAEFQVRSIHVGACPGMGDGDVVNLRLSSGQTVLVGKNGAGKSLIMGAAVEGARMAIGSHHGRWDPDPKYFSVELGDSARTLFTYEYRAERPDPAEADSETPSPSRPSEPVPQVPPRPKWFERCFDDNGIVVWKVEQGQLFIAKREPIPIPRGVGLMGLGPDAVEGPPAELLAVRTALQAFSMVPAGVLRRHSGRHFVIVGARKREDNKRVVVRLPGSMSDRVDRLTASIIRAHENNPELFTELSEVLLRLRLIQEPLTVSWFELPGSARQQENGPDVWGSVFASHDNIGYLSDGTLRVFEIVLAILSYRGVLWIEEPETAIHPGLLEELLGFISSYAHDRQVVMSTHSPYVVNLCAPADLRLVERVKGSTRVRELSIEDSARVASYLRNEGSLDEYVFASDEFDELDDLDEDEDEDE